MIFGNALPKSNARAHLKQRKKHSGLSCHKRADDIRKVDTWGDDITYTPVPVHCPGTHTATECTVPDGRQTITKTPGPGGRQTITRHDMKLYLTILLAVISQQEGRLQYDNQHFNGKKSTIVTQC